MIKRIIYWVIMAALITTFLVIAFLCLDDYLNMRSDYSGWSIISLCFYAIMFFIPISFVFTSIEIILTIKKKHKTLDYVLLSLLWMVSIASILITFLSRYF